MKGREARSWQRVGKMTWPNMWFGNTSVFRFNSSVSHAPALILYCNPNHRCVTFSQEEEDHSLNHKRRVPDRKEEIWGKGKYEASWYAIRWWEKQKKAVGEESRCRQAVVESKSMVWLNSDVYWSDFQSPEPVALCMRAFSGFYSLLNMEARSSRELRAPESSPQPKTDRNW